MTSEFELELSRLKANADTQKKFLDFLKSKAGYPVLWGAKGEVRLEGGVKVAEVYDCSGLVTCGIYHATGIDMRLMWNAKRLSNECGAALPASVIPIPGDLCFYGKSWENVIHVAVWLHGGHVITGNGATKSRLQLVQALAHRDKVHLEASPEYRKDYLGIKRNKWINPPYAPPEAPNAA